MHITKRILWVAQLIAFSWGTASAQFNPLTLPVANSAPAERFLGLDDGSSPLYWLRSWDYGQGKIYATNNILSLGGPVPDSAMIAYLDTSDARIPGHSYITSQMGIPFYKAGPDSTYFTFPGQTDTFPIASGPNGFFRLHHSLLYIYGTQNNSSGKFRAINDSSLGRPARVRTQFNGSNTGNISDIVDPYLQPASNIGRDFGDGNPLPATTLQGSPIPTVRWTLFSMMFMEDPSTIPFHWPGFATGDYDNFGTDGPHFAFNVWQVKGRFSGTVPMSLKWRGQQLIAVVQDPAGNFVDNPILLGPNAVSGFTDSLSSHANKWLDFLVRTKPGYTNLGDNPGIRIYYKESDATTWNLLYEYQGDLLSEIESNALSLQSQYGIPVHYLGLGNGGIYPSIRLSGSLLSNYWTPFRLAHPDRAFMKVRHSEYFFTEYGEGLEPNEASIFALANAAMPPLVGSNSSFPVEYLAFEASPEGNAVALDWTTASESHNAYFQIERSQDGTQWESLGKVTGAGTSTQPISYQFKDVSPYAGNNFYRLQQVDLDGSHSFSAVRQVQFSGANTLDLRVYPNPVKSGQTLSLRVPVATHTEPLTIVLQDVRGAQLFTQTISPETLKQQGGTLPIRPTLSSGVYVLKVQQGDQHRFQKIIVH